MMGAATPFSKLKRPDDSRPTGGLGQYRFAEDAVDERIVKSLVNKINIASEVMGEELKDWL